MNKYFSCRINHVLANHPFNLWGWGEIFKGGDVVLFSGWNYCGLPIMLSAAVQGIMGRIKNDIKKK